MAFAKGLIKPYYTQGIRSIVAENIILQSVSFDRQSQYLLHRLVADSAYASILKPSAARDLYKSVMNRFEIAQGLLFNYNISLNKLEKRTDFADIATKMLHAGQLGAKPTNLSPDLKITKDEAERLRRDGKVVEEWFIRTEEEEKIVEHMKEEWVKQHGPIKKLGVDS